MMGVKQKVRFLRSILCVAEAYKEGQITAASKHNGMKQSNFSRELKSLERELGFKVFTRMHNGVALTKNGEQIYVKACNIEKILYDVEKISKCENKLAGTIQLWVGEGIGSAYVGAYLSSFYEKYPDVRLDIKCTLESPQLLDDIDIAFVYKKPPLDAIVLLKNTMKFRLYASKTYLSKFGYPKNLEDLQQNHRLCTRTDFASHWPQWSNFLAESEHVVATTDSSSMLYGLVKDSVGISLIPTCIARNDPAMVQLSNIPFEIDHTFWAISRKEAKDLPKVRALINHLKEMSSTIFD